MHARDYPYHIDVEVAFHDLDAMGHVNNSTYFVYMETARIKYLIDELGADMGRTPISMVVAEASCTYHSPAFRRERLVVGVGVGRMGNKSFDLLYRIEAPDRLVAAGKTVQVAYDYDKDRPVPLPEDFRTVVRAYQGDWEPPPS